MLIRLHEMSKEIVPEIIQPAAQNHAPPGECHDLPDPGPVIPAVTMDRAFFAGRFRLQRASAPLCHGMPGHLRAFATEKCFSYGDLLNLHIRFATITMFSLAINPDEIEEEPDIFNLCIGKLFHGCMITDEAKERYDAGQKILFPSPLCFSVLDMLG